MEFNVHEHTDNSSPAQSMFDIALLSIIADKVTSSGAEISFYSQMTPEKHQRATEFTDYYSEIDPRIHRFRKFLHDIPVGHYYCLCPVEILDPHVRLYIMDSIKKLNAKHMSIDEILKDTTLIEQSKELFSGVYDLYEVSQPDSFMGEPEKSKRTCIYCQNSKKPTSFNSKAHLIPESLGNKKYVQYEECDICNNDFGKGVDDSLATFLNFFRVMFNVKGKDGPLKLEFRNYATIKRVSDDKVEIRFVSGAEAPLDLPPQEIPFETLNKIRLQNVYRSLARIGISSLKADERNSYSKTIDWINEKTSRSSLPKVNYLINPFVSDKGADLILYKRKNEDTRFPSFVVELHIKSLILVYLVQNDDEFERFTTDAEIEQFWESMSHYSRLGGWNAFDLSEEKPVSVQWNLKLVAKDQDRLSVIGTGSQEELSQNPYLQKFGSY
jgi:hypothetical protein